MSKIWFLSFSLFVMSAAYANEDLKNDTEIEVPSPWNSQVELGYQAHSGNTDSESLNSRVKTEYITGRHRTNGEWKLYRLDKNGKENKRQANYSLQSDYKLASKAYLYANFNGVDSKYSAYFKDYTLSGGMGYQLMNTDILLLEIEIGPGFRYQKPNLDEISSTDIVFANTVEEVIFRGNLKGVWATFDNLTISSELTLVAGESNIRTDSELILTNHITDSIALKVNLSRQYHDKVPAGLSKADSVTSFSLQFRF
ncbi:hypothetical protein CEG15_01365 [Vibrio anguillarum]|uniref:DUF481 domain-containing protein n=1 Tax=Vibrio anguillarum TaxID=55601 RepID=UPI000B53FF04|nr:DUF481 domain-containing protein [Vibrio anguillarum]ASF98886.1 hypothetical protein CEG15_01365 [Vibrio anguillarum]